MKKYLKLFARTFGVSTSVMLIYRANVAFFLIFEAMFMAAQFLTVKVGFDLAGGEIAGWTRDQVYLMTAVNGLTHQFFLCFFIGPIFNLGMQVWNGQYDYILLKPLHPFVSMVANGQFIISNLPNLVLNLGLVVFFLMRDDAPFAWHLIPVFAVFVMLGVAVRAAVALLCVAPVFFSERLTDIEDSFWSVISLGRYPLSVYPRGLELFLTFIVPIGMVASVPAEVLFRPDSAGALLGAFVASVLFVIASAALFMKCLGRYQSVNSGV
jgi:ABC-2 type transport system permease protein